MWESNNWRRKAKMSYISSLKKVKSYCFVFVFTIRCDKVKRKDIIFSYNIYNI